jgi:hypothetical protein
MATHLQNIPTLMTLMVTLLLVPLWIYSEALCLRVVFYISIVEWDVNMFVDCIACMGVIPGHTANQVLRCECLRLLGRDLRLYASGNYLARS